MSTPEDYFYGVDHPALFHWVDRAVLKAVGVEIGPVPKVNLREDYNWHIANGRIAPRRPVRILRIANVVALSGAMAAFFFLARLALGGRWWAFALVAPLVLPENLGVNVGGYIKTDAYLAFFLAVTLYFSVRFHCSGAAPRFAQAAVMGILAGLSVSTKLNGGLVFLAYAAYLAIVCRGLDRFWLLFIFASVTLTVFVAVNPVLQKGGAEGLVMGLVDMIKMRARTYRLHEAMFGKMSILDRFLFMFPHWYLFPALAVVVANARREKWFLPVGLWSLFLIVGTALTVQQPFNRYLMPIDFGLTVVVGLSAMSIAQRLYRGETTLPELVGIVPRRTGPAF
jgi:hypothetical protein